jgi:hypothetical protein
MWKVLLTILLIGTESLAASPKGHAQLRAVLVKRPNIVVRGAYLAKVEIWAVPTGTGITEDEYTLVGAAKRSNAAGGNEIWLFRITCESPLVSSTEVFAKGFDESGYQIGRKSLPYTSLTAIAHALCGEP